MSLETSQSPQTHQAWCVIWRAPDTAVPVELRGALDRRGVHAVECDNACWATAELCRLHAAQPESPVILLLVDPASLEEVDEVIAVAEHYAPHATAWVYESQVSPPLRALDRPHRGQNAADSQSTRNLEDPAGLRLTEVPGHDDELKTDNPTPLCEMGQESPSILSRDELASLKHPDRVSGPDA
ncbi:MAG: hypothetical protein DYG94_13370 [Leptolyngbya sp. PLA3]|nr:MAG: hypothetical protein EDM82_13925 [Cyanobacteria bacterium CYA]MCE7969716.1 hypothetical protein [Leptolyngbya sp. PL-A3]